MAELRERLRLDSRDGDNPITKGAKFDGARSSLEFSIVENMTAFAEAVESEEWPSSISHLQSAAMAALKLASWILAQAPEASAAVAPTDNKSVAHTMADVRAFLAALRECLGEAEDEDKPDVRSRDPEKAE